MDHCAAHSTYKEFCPACIVAKKAANKPAVPEPVTEVVADKAEPEATE